MARRINLNYFKLEPAVVGEGQYQPANRALRDFIRQLDQRTWEPIRIPDGWLVFNNLLRENGYFVGSISRIQTQNIPGRRAPNDATSSPIAFRSPDEGLDHPTCFILDTATNIIVLESLQLGVTINQFCGFFSANLNMDIGATVLIAQDVDTFFQNLRQVRRISFRVSRIENLSQLQRQRFSGLNGVFGMSDMTGSRQLEIVMGPEPHQRNPLNLEAVRRFLTDLVGISDFAQVDYAKVYGSAGFAEGDSFQEVDIIEQRLKDFILVENVREVTPNFILQRQQQMIARYEPRRQDLVRLYRVPNE